MKKIPVYMNSRTLASFDRRRQRATSNDIEDETPPRHTEAFANTIEIGLLPVLLSVIDLPLSVGIIMRAEHLVGAALVHLPGSAHGTAKFWSVGLCLLQIRRARNLLAA